MEPDSLCALPVLLRYLSPLSFPLPILLLSCPYDWSECKSELEWAIKSSQGDDLETEKSSLEEKPGVHRSGNEFSRQKEEQMQKLTWKQVGRVGDRKKGPDLRGQE